MNFNEWGPATLLVVLLTVLAAGVGGAVVLFGPQLGQDALTFKDYIDVMSKFAIGLGILGIGRGIKQAGIVSSGVARPSNYGRRKTDAQ